MALANWRAAKEGRDLFVEKRMAKVNAGMPDIPTFETWPER